MRLCTVPFVVRQLRSQRELREHMPRMKALPQEHKGDKERLQRERRAYYRVSQLASSLIATRTHVRAPAVTCLHARLGASGMPG